MNTKIIETITATKDGEIKLACPNCNISKIFDIKKYIKHPNKVRAQIRCKCGYNTSLFLERRNAYRKKASFIGYCVNKDIAKKLEITIINLSANGIRFKINDLFKHKFKRGDKLTIEIQANKISASLIQKKVVIRSFSDSFVSVEFIE